MLIGEDYEATVTMPAATVSFIPGGEVDIPDRTYRFDLTNNSILIEAINPTVFFGSLAFEFSSFESPTGTGITISNAVIRQPTPAPMTDFDLTFDADSIAVEYFYDIFAPTTYSEIEIGITFVPINHNSAMLIICPFLLLTFASSKAKSANHGVTTTYKRIVSLRRLTAYTVNLLVSSHFLGALQSTPYSQRQQPSREQA